VTLACTTAEPTASVTIDCGQAARVDIVTDKGGAVTIDSGTVVLTSESSLTIESKGTVSVSGPSIVLGG
jgi:hypothetical protein